MGARESFPAGDRGRGPFSAAAIRLLMGPSWEPIEGALGHPGRQSPNATTRQPDKAASAAARPKLSYREEDRKILDSCIRRESLGAGSGGEKVMRGWGGLAGRPDPTTRADQSVF